MSRLYFAYGSNMSETTLRERGIEAERAGIGFLPGYRLAFTLPSRRWTGRAADILETPLTGVWGVLWRLTDAAAFDTYEANYDRVVVSVSRHDGDPGDRWAPNVRTDVLTYTVRVANRSAIEAAPAPAYAQRMLDGAEAARLPGYYLAFLRASTDERSFAGDLILVDAPDGTSRGLRPLVRINRADKRFAGASGVLVTNGRSTPVEVETAGDVPPGLAHVDRRLRNAAGIGGPVSPGWRGRIDPPE
jgi:hypothetical protein